MDIFEQHRLEFGLKQKYGKDIFVLPCEEKFLVVVDDINHEKWFDSFDLKAFEEFIKTC